MDLEEYKKIMQRKYDEYKVPDSVGKNIIQLAKKRKEEELKKKKKFRNNLLKVAASFAIVLGITSIVFLTLNHKKVNVEIADDFVEDEINDNDSLVVGTLFLEHDIEIMNYKKIVPVVVGVVRLDKVLNYSNYSKKQEKYYTDVITIMEIEMKDCIYCKNEVNNSLKIYKAGGIISVSNLKKSTNLLYKQKKYIDSIEDDEQYIEVISKNSLIQAEPIVGKTYLVCLKEDKDVYEGYYCYGKYGFVEYDEETGKVKNVETGEWEEIDKEILDIDNLRESSK